MRRRIEAARGGERRALEELLGAYRGYLRVLAAGSIDRGLRSKVDASDVVQEALLKAHRSFSTFRGTLEPELVAWLRKILVRSLIDVQRRYALNAGRRLERERSLDRVNDQSSRSLAGLLRLAGPSPSGAARQKETSVLLAEALGELDPDGREVILLRSLQELEWSEVAERMGRSPDAVRMLWNRALVRLGRLLQGRL
jgi:RNA polymerase sigma-70 factor (ECF subfamily)